MEDVSFIRFDRFRGNRWFVSGGFDELFSRSCQNGILATEHEDGDFDLLIAASAADIRQTLTVTLESTLNLPCILDKESTLSEWLADPRGMSALGNLYAEIETTSHRVFGGDNGTINS